MPRPYIGSRRNRPYIYNRALSSSLLPSNHYFSTYSSSNSFLPYHFQDQIPLDDVSSPIPLDQKQLYREQEAEGSLPLPTSSRFLSPTIENITTSTCHDQTSPLSFSSSIKEQQKSPYHCHHYQYEDQHSYGQLSSTENENRRSLLSEQLNYQEEPKQSIIHDHHIDQYVPLERNISFSSSNLSNHTSVGNNDNNNQSHLLTSTSILHQPSSCHPTTNDHIFNLSSSKKNNNCKSLPHISNKTLDRLSIVSTQEPSKDCRHKDDIKKLNYTLSLRHLSSSGMDRVTRHIYDQRIIDQDNKYIIQLKTDDYRETEFIITPSFYQNQLIIDAKHSEEDNFGGYIRRELHKVFLIPKHIDLNKYTYSYDKYTRKLTIEMPYLQPTTNENKTNPSLMSSIPNETQSMTFSYGDMNPGNEEDISSMKHKRLNRDHITMTDTNIDHKSQTNSENNDSTIRNNTVTIPSTNNLSFEYSKPFHGDLFHSQISQTTLSKNHEKKFLMSLVLNEYQPEDITVTVKDHELIVRAEKIIETNTRKSRTSFCQSTSLPLRTDIERLQSSYLNGKLFIEAPYLDQEIPTISYQETNG